MNWRCVRVYYETIKWKINIRLIYECRCDERLNVKTEGSTRLTYTELRGGLEHLKVETRLIDERFASVRGVCETVGYVCLLWIDKVRDLHVSHTRCSRAAASRGCAPVLEVIGTTSIFKFRRKAAALVGVLPTLSFNCGEENVTRRKWKSPRLCCGSWTPEAAKKRSVSRWVC